MTFCVITATHCQPPIAQPIYIYMYSRGLPKCHHCDTDCTEVSGDTDGRYVCIVLPSTLVPL